MTTTYSQQEFDEAYEIGKREGYEQAVQEIDMQTGGDGVYRTCLGGADPERHTPDAPAMIQRIVDRFEILNLLDEATKTGSDQPDDSPSCGGSGRYDDAAIRAFDSVTPRENHLLAYRFLVEGDLIEATDEFIGNDGQTWARPDGWEVGMEYPSRVFKSARRLVSSPSRDQATGSRPMDEASLPTTSRLSQLEARTSCAASVNVRLTSPSPQPQNIMVETKWLRFLETLQAHLGDANAAIIFELKPSVRGKALPDEQSSSHEDHSIGCKNVGLLEIIISHDASLVVVNPVVELSHAGLQAQSRLRIVETTYKGEGCTKLDLIPQVGVAGPPTQKLSRGDVPCPCTIIEQDEDCPIGYPSMVCGICKGKGHTTQEQVTALACEIIKIASDVGEPEDPFAAWESIHLMMNQVAGGTGFEPVAPLRGAPAYQAGAFDRSATPVGGGDIGDVAEHGKMAAPLNDLHVATPELGGVELAGVAEQLEQGAGAWRACSGCHELIEGHPTGPWSETLKSYMGGGCRECGGIGAIWDSTDYSQVNDPAPMTTVAGISLELMGLIVDEVFDGAIEDASVIEEIYAVIKRHEAAPQHHSTGTVDCPCTTFEQDEDCPVGYPSLLRAACDGKGIAPIDKVVAFAAEMMKVAEQVDELEDPFAAWETIDLIKSQHGQLRAALKPFAAAPYTGPNSFNRAALSDDDFRQARHVLASTEWQL